MLKSFGGSRWVVMVKACIDAIRVSRQSLVPTWWQSTIAGQIFWITVSIEEKRQQWIEQIKLSQMELILQSMKTQRNWSVWFFIGIRPGFLFRPLLRPAPCLSRTLSLIFHLCNRISLYQYKSHFTFSKSKVAFVWWSPEANINANECGPLLLVIRVNYSP